MQTVIVAMQHGIPVARIEILDDVQMDDVLGLRLNVWTSIVLFVLATAWFIWSAVRHPGREEVVRTREPEGETAQRAG